MALHIKADGTEVKIEPANGKKFSLEELQKMVGGYIEVVRIAKTDHGDHMLVNEDGRMKQLPVNVSASKLFGRGMIVGDAVVLSRRQMG